MEEEWRDICGYEGKYQVSSMGRVKSLNYNNTRKERFLKPGKNKDGGYLQVMLCKNNKQKMFLVHRLVSCAFINNPDNKPFIDHVNTIKTDNRVENLMWVTAKENSDNPISRKHYLDNSPVAGKFGKEHPRAKAVLQYSLDGKLIRKWACATDAERELGFDQGHISYCCSGKYKTSYGYIWKYA